jgi:hypothetical protein
LRGGVVVHKEFFLAIFDQEPSVLVFAVAERVHVLAEVEVFVDGPERKVNGRVDANGVFTISFLSIEIRETFTADGAGEDILMHVDQSVNSSLTKVGDQLVDGSEVFSVIYTSCAFNSFPHDAESDKVHAPTLKVLDIFSVEGVLGVEGSLGWDVGILLVNNVYTVEDYGTTVIVDKLSGFGIDADSCIDHHSSGAESG